MNNHRIEQLSENFLKEVWKRVPFSATQMGIHDYDEDMPDFSLKGYEELHQLSCKLKEDLKNINPDEENLDFQHRISREALIQTLQLEDYSHETLGFWRSKPEAGMQTAEAIHTLFIKEFAPLPHRLEKIAARLEKTPEFIEKSQELITDPVMLWIDTAIDETEGAKELIDIVIKTAEENASQSLFHRVTQAGEKAKEALDKHIAWQRETLLPKSREDYTISHDVFKKLLEIRQLGMSMDELLDFGQEMLDYSREKLRETAVSIAQDKTYAQVKRMMLENHPPTFEEALMETKRRVEESRDFVKKSGFATLPEGENLQVIQTPAFMQKVIPTGAYSPPGLYDKNQTGYYYMTKPDSNDPAGLEIHNIGAILNTSVHEGYPGHHLQLACANKNPYFSRILCNGDEFIEGWAHYCEEAVAEIGFCTQPEVTFERYADMLFRAARIIIDIKLCCGEMGYEEAIKMLQDISGFQREPCKIEVDRYTITPGYQLSYLTGKKLILDLKRDVKEKAGSNFSLSKFHDTMLYAGSLPMKQMREIVFEAFGLSAKQPV